VGTTVALPKADKTMQKLLLVTIQVYFQESGSQKLATDAVIGKTNATAPNQHVPLVQPYI
jgi:hypothetical protein